MRTYSRSMRALMAAVVAGAASAVILSAQAPQQANPAERESDTQTAPQQQPGQEGQQGQAQQGQPETRQAGQTAQPANGDAEAIEFMGTVVRATFPTRPFELRLDRFSNEAERQKVASVFKEADDPKAVAEALKELEAIGSFRTISGWGNEIRYAEEVTSPDGTRKLLLATDRQINYWEGANAPKAVTEAYTFIEVRFKDGEGVGRSTHGDVEVVVDPSTNMPSIENFDELQPELLGVKRVEEDQQQ